MVRHQKPPSQTWRTFLENHADCIAGIDFFTVPTVTFRVLYVFIVLSHDRRHIVHFNVTAHPTAQWTAQQLVEAFPFDSAPRVCCAIGMPFMVIWFTDGSRAWALRKLSLHLARPGKIYFVNVLSDPSTETVWITSSSLTSDTCAESFASTSVTTILVERTYRWTKIRLKPDPLNRRRWVLLSRFLESAACTIATAELQHDGDGKE